MPNIVVLENLIGHSVVLSRLERCWGVNMGDTVDGIAKLAVGFVCGVNELDCTRDVDLTILVRTLWIGSGSICGQVPTE